VRLFKQRHHDAFAALAAAEALPVADGALDAVVGLCVLDAVPAPERARDEIRRALRPGGRLIHLLDLTTNLTGLFSALALEGLVPLPNFFDGLAGLPEPEPLADLLVAPYEQLAAVVGLLERAGHALAGELADHVALFDPDAADGDAAARAFVALTGDRQARARFSEFLGQLHLTLESPKWREAVPLTLRPLSSTRHFEERLRQMYASAHGFEIEFSGVVSARDALPVDATPAGCRFLGFWVGTRARRARVPEAPAGRWLAEITGEPSDGALPTEAAPAGTSTREVGVHVLVARRG